MHSVVLFYLASVALIVKALPMPDDPCAIVAGKAFVTPAAALACQKSFQFNETLRQNVLTTVARVFDFYTFEEFYLQSPPPFQDSTADIRAQLARINSTSYATDFDFNKDLYDFTTQLNDGHTRWFPDCYLSYQNLLPAPLVSLAPSASSLSEASIFIAPDSTELISLIGPEYLAHLAAIPFNFSRLSGARVLAINYQDPFTYLDTIASTVSGNFLDHNIRFNSALSSYRISRSDFSQRFGDAAGPFVLGQDSLTMTLIPVGSAEPETISIPFVANYQGKNFTDQASYWAHNCAADSKTNGIDQRTVKSNAALPSDSSFTSPSRKARANILDFSNEKAVGLPTEFLPKLQASPGSNGVIKSFMLNNTTGVMFIGSFESNFSQFQNDVATAIDDFQRKNLTKLVIDTTNNGGGFICLGIFLHQFLVGSRFGYSGFESSIRANLLARKIVAEDIRLGFKNQFTRYTPDGWAFVNDTQIPASFNLNDPSVSFVVNGKSDPTSQRLHDLCTPDFEVPIPESPPFDIKNIAIVNNGMCASTCALFATGMSERHGTKIAVFGGRAERPIEFKGMAGNQVLEWPELDTEIKTAGLKQDSLAPPDLLVSGNFRHNWRTAWSFLDKNTSIAYLSEAAKYRFAYTNETYNNPQKVWTLVAATLLA